MRWAGAHSGQTGAAHPSAPQSALALSPHLALARPHPRQAVLHPWLPSAPRSPASGSPAAPPALQPPTRPPDPSSLSLSLSLGLPASAAPRPAPPGPRRPISPLRHESPHPSLAPAPPAPRPRAPGSRSPRSPRASPATQPLGVPRAAPAGPAHFPSPGAAGVAQAQSGRGGRARAGALLPPGGLQAHDRGPFISGEERPLLGSGCSRFSGL